MSVVFYRGTALGPNDANIKIETANGEAIDPFEINYSIFDKTNGTEILLPPANRTPVRKDVGVYYSDWVIPNDSNLGTYVIRWNFREYSDSVFVSQPTEIAVVGLASKININFTQIENFYIKKLRCMLRDNNPDRNRHFAPPSSEKRIASFTENYGYIWDDEELMCYMWLALSDIANTPYMEEYELSTIPRRLASFMLMAASCHALRALSINYAGEDFDYSLNGVSLNLDRFSKYSQMKENFETRYEKEKEEYKKSIKIIKGLKQPRWSPGTMRYLGPLSSTRISTVQNYIYGDLSSRGSWI